MRAIFTILLLGSLLPGALGQGLGNVSLDLMAVDVCGNEASSEYFLLTVVGNKYDFASFPPQVKSYCPDSSIYNRVITAYTANPTAVTALNAKVGTCTPVVFYDFLNPPYSGGAGMGQRIMLFVSANPDIAAIPAGALANLCGHGPILVAFGNYTGTDPFFFNNHPYNNACGAYSLADFTVGSNLQTVQYNPARLAASDGAFVALDQDYIVRYGQTSNCSVAELACSTPPVVTFTGTEKICEHEKTTITANAGAGYQYAWSTGATTASIDVAPVITTTYTVTVTSTTAPQCQSSAKFTVQVFRFPRTRLYTEGVGGGAACYQGQLFLRKTITPVTDTPATFQWIPPHAGIVIAPDQSITVNEQTAGTYQCVLQYSNGCVDRPTVEVSYSVQTPLRICTNSPVCAGESARLEVSYPGTNYHWTGPNGYSATGPSQVIPNPAAGAYQITMKDENGCSLTGSTVVLLKNCGPLPLLSSLNITQTTCGLNNGALTVTATQGTSPYTYQWSHLSGSNQPAVVNNLAPATYAVTVTDADGATNTASANILASSSPSVALSGTATTCGNFNGAITTTVTNGTSPYTFNWADLTPPPNEPQNRVQLAPGSYSVTVTDMLGCTGSATASIGTSLGVNATATFTNISCHGQHNGAINVTVGGGSTPYTMNWADLSSSPEPEDRSNLAPGVYNLTVTGANGCTATISATITEPPALTATAVWTNAACGNASGSATLTVGGGTTPYNFDWADLGGTNNPQNRTGLNSGTYTVTVADAQGCADTLNHTILQLGSPSVSDTVTNVNCYGQSTGAILLTVTGGTTPYSYNWADITSGPEPEDRTGLPAGTYSVTVTDASGCTQTRSRTITQPAAALSGNATITNASCGASNGAITLSVSGGTSPYSFDWADLSTPPEPQNRSNLAAANYFVTISDTKGCTATLSPTVLQPSSMNLSATSVNASCGQANGSITLSISGGTTPYNFDWFDVAGTNNPQNRTGLNAGTYVVTVTDASGCTSTLSRTLSQTGSPSLSATSTNIDCFGQATGAIQLTVTSGTTPYSYNWADLSTPPEPEDRTNIPAGTYAITVTDASGCTQTGSYSVTQPAAALSSTVSATNATCNNNNGTITLTVSGGTSPYSFDWSDINSPPEPQNRTNLAPGNYTVTITDNKGCTKTTNATIEISGIPTVTGVVTNLTCNGNFSGAINITVTNGTSPYTYNWADINTPPEPEDRTGLYAATYTVTVTSALGCTASLSKTVTQPTLLGIAKSSTNTTCNLSNGTATATATGGVAPYVYDWGHIPGSPDPNALTGLSPGTYNITVTDANGCTATASFGIASSTAVSLSAVVTNTSCNNNNGAITITATGGGPAGVTYMYDWAHIPGNSDIQNLTNLWPGVFSITVTATGGCTASASYTITASTAVTVTGTVSNASCNVSNGSITQTASGATGPYTYDWSHIAGTNNPQNVSGIGAGTYTVTVTSANGCTKVKSYTLTNTGNISATPTVTSTGCGAYANTGAISLSVSGATGPYTFLWSNGATTQNITNLTSDRAYKVTVTDANGCTYVSPDIPMPTLFPAFSGAITNPPGNNNGSITLTVTGGASPFTFDWSHIAGTNNPQNVSSLAAGTYSVTVSGSNQCTSVNTFVITNNLTGPGGNNALNQTGGGVTQSNNPGAAVNLHKPGISTDTTALVKVYPNPASTAFTIGIPPLLGQCDIRIYDALTRLILVTEGRDDVVIHTDGWPSALYFILIRQQNDEAGNPIWKTLLISR